MPEILLSCEKFVDYSEELHGILFAWVVTGAGDCRNLYLRQYLTKFILGNGGHDVTAAA